ncbi:MAG: hypothetical protein R2780_12300 [Crocinitomicaceae bacterium]|nr:hypothetical protein [Crocinitomicaceae bacterium]
MRWFVVFCLFVGFKSFGAGIIPKTRIEPLFYRHFPPKDVSYASVIAKINKDRLSLRSNQVSNDSCRTYFLEQFEHKVFPYWVGTKWDYNGYTNEPGEDKLIACGYFVSTPLKHMGFNWNRYKLAQMYSKNIVETICEDMTKYSDKMEMIQTLKERENNLYIVGLDSHVGMLLKTDKQLWFVHSNYYNIEGPVKEVASMSLALGDSDSFYVGTLLSDNNIQKWLNGTLFPTST